MSNLIVTSRSDTSVRPLPMSLDAITPQWLTAALRVRAPGVTVRAFEVVDVIHKTTTLVRVKLDMDEEGRRAGIPDRVILKGGFEPHSRDMWQMHEMEVRGYRDVLAVLELPAPQLYFADYNHDQRQAILIMEDLTLRGVDFCSALRPQSFDQVAGRLSALARFHARTWGSPELEQGRWSWLSRGMSDIRYHLQQSCIEKPQVWRHFVTSPRGAAVSTRFHDAQWAREALNRLARLSDSLPHVLLHGDAHLDNTYITADGSHGFYDPMCHRDHAMRDVGYHIAGALDTADRGRWEGPLLQHYLDELSRLGVPAPGFDEALRIYAAYLAVGLIIWLCNDTVFQPEVVNTANAARFSAAMLDHDTMGILASLA